VKLTPLDIKQKTFARKGDRYDAAEVDGFLEVVRVELEDRIREGDALRQEGGRLKEEVERLRRDEKMLKEALISIQRFSEDIKETAHKKAELIRSEAELEAERIISQAQHDAGRVREDINELIRQRVQFEASLRRLIDVHKKLLDATVAREDAPRRRADDPDRQPD
jgi:cell division initiation protein